MGKAEQVTRCHIKETLGTFWRTEIKRYLFARCDQRIAIFSTFGRYQIVLVILKCDSLATSLPGRNRFGATMGVICR
jgi:hypothetical protein